MATATSCNPKWITVNSRLENGIVLINSLSSTKFQLLIKHIAEATSDEIFTPEELKKLEDSLKLNETSCQLLIQSILYILKQSNKIIIKPTTLQKELVDLNIEPEKAEEFVKMWSNKMKDDFGDFSNRNKLQGVSWEMNLQTASSLSTEQIIPNARIHLNLQNVKDETKNETVTLQLCEQELLQLYNTLENVQSKLDIISSKR